MSHFHTSLSAKLTKLKINHKHNDKSFAFGVPKAHYTPVRLGVSKPKASHRRALRALHKARLRAYQCLFYVKDGLCVIGVKTSCAGATSYPIDCLGDCSRCSNM